MIGIASITGLFAGARGSLITAAACIAICLPVGYCTGQNHQRSKDEVEHALATVAVTQTARTADQAAAVRAVDDALHIAKRQGELTDAIAEAPDGAPDAARVALGCERLRHDGRAEADLPSVCHGRGIDGSQAPTIR